MTRQEFWTNIYMEYKQSNYGHDDCVYAADMAVSAFDERFPEKPDSDGVDSPEAAHD